MIPLCRRRRIYAAPIFLLLFCLSAASGDDLRDAYLKAHPFEAENLEKIQKLKDAKISMGSDPASMDKVLDGLFDGGVKKGEGAPPGPVAPAGGGLSPATQGDKAASVIGVAAVPKVPAIRFVSQPPKNFISSVLWRLKGGARGEKAYFDKVMEGLNTKTESEILDQLARNQERFALRQAVDVREAEEELKSAEADLAEAEGLETDKDLLEIKRQNIMQMRSNKEWLKNRSPEVLVSFVDFADGTIGEEVWMDQHAADGKYHVGVSLSRDLVPVNLFGAAKNIIEKGRKTATHEFSHAVDDLDPEGMQDGATEPTAYLMEARSFQEEGQPRGRKLERERNSFLELKSDLLGWMTRHLSRRAYMGDGRLWAYLTVDDVRDPEAGLRWRLRLIYYRATLPKENLPRLVKGLSLHRDVQWALEAVLGDPHILAAEKPAAFAERAASAASCREWVEKVKKMDEAQTRRILKAQKAFWRNYAEFIAEP